MSTSADSALNTEAASLRATINYCNTSATGMLSYDEFKHYFKRKVTLAMFLYMANRYILLVFAFYNAPWGPFSSHEKICAAQTGIQFTLEALQYFPWAIFSALRTYALQRKLRWAILVLILSLITVILSSVKEHWLMIHEVPRDGCTLSENIPVLFQRRPFGPALSRGPIIIADIITIVITWKTQYQTYNIGRKVSAPSTIATVFLRDGTIYFVVLSVLNTILLVFDYLQVFTDRGASLNLSYLVIFVEPITSILISDFLTHLHEAADAACDSGTLASASTLEFRIIGPIGASLPGLDDVTGTFRTEDSGSWMDSEERSQSDEVMDFGVEVEEVARREAEV
ncbi:hypothetical protein ONZ51_g4715 [Trametes cubensis]|uniref:Uncharacterized protein n=1 Tax=Trametes cubensis TaxID=1111947 RepID=A0AAD7TVB4_9APHY|nr:hypothetical protein ONZ51_g4715 [Trametes cubensis]